MNEKINKGYELLANAIIYQAATDYRKAIKYGYTQTQEECERFFRSEYFKVLTNIDGEYLIDRIRKETEKKCKKERRKSPSRLANL